MSAVASEEFLEAGQQLLDRKLPGEKTIWKPSPNSTPNIWYSAQMPYPLSTTLFPPDVHHQRCFCCVINPFARKVLQRELQIMQPNTSRRRVTAAVTRVPLSLCRMLEDDLKISSDEEEAEQQVSSGPSLHSLWFMYAHIISPSSASSTLSLNHHTLDQFHMCESFMSGNQLNLCFWKLPLTIHPFSHLLVHQLIHASNHSQSAVIWAPSPLNI